MRKFVNRRIELGFLERKFASKEAEMIVIYGRRRIGKTELMLQFCREKEFMYFIGRLESKEDTLRRFNNLLIETFKDKALINSPLRDWDSMLEYLGDKSKRRTILIIDEFPFIVERFPEIVSVLQDKWDSKLKNSKIMLILSGSSVSMMEKYALDYKSPLYGRRTGQWKVDRLAINHLAEFFPDYKLDDLIRVYSCLDTIPGYLARFSPEMSFSENLRDKLFSKGEFLYEEVEILLREEFRDPSNYMSIISSIAGGLTSFNEVNNRTRLDKSLLSKYLGVLENLGIIERLMPITESYKTKLKSRGALYSLKDNFFDFWFRFIYLNKQELERGNAAIVLKSMKPEFEQYVSRKFELFSMEFLSLGEAGTFNCIGRWWSKEQEIDIIALSEERKEILFGECKWQEKANAIEIANALCEKAKLVDWNRSGRKEILAIFAKSFSRKISDFEGRKVYCFDMEKMSLAIKSSKSKSPDHLF